MRIITINIEDAQMVEQCAALLVAGFREHWPDAWPEMEAAREEVRAFSGPERICRVALDDDNTVLGWIGGLPEYDGLVWELHPMVVRADQQRQGIGRALVNDLEMQVQARGGLTITLGTDDEDNMTTVGGIDLYPDPLAHLSRIQNLRGHPYEFYQKLGFALTGIVPDANGPGKPDILMAKRVQPQRASTS